MDDAEAPPTEFQAIMQSLVEWPCPESAAATAATAAASSSPGTIEGTEVNMHQGHQQQPHRQV